MLYSIYTMDSILEEEEELELFEMEIKGRPLLLQKSGPLLFQIERLLSTDPDDFLEGEHYPGLVMDLRENL